MNKEEFLLLLKKRLAYLSNAELKKHLDFYEEAINDRIDDGINEFDAVKDLGELNDIVEFIKSEDNEKKSKKEVALEVKEKVVETVNSLDLDKVGKKFSNVILLPVLVISIILTILFVIFGFVSLMFSVVNLDYNKSTLFVMFAQSFGSIGIALMFTVVSMYCMKLLKNNKEEIK